MKFFTVKYALFIIVVAAALLTRWLDLPLHWHGDGACLVLQPGAMAPAHLLSGIVMLGLC